MRNRERLGAYLERIGYTGPAAPTLEVLRAMHRAHFYTIPFENLSIARGERIHVDPDHNFRKVVERQRGGFCIELTGLFAWALRELGFEVDLFGAQVIQADGNPGAERSHMALRVHVPTEDGVEPWLADVGFGGQVAGPLRMTDPNPQHIEGREYTVFRDGDRWTVTCREPWQAAPGTYVFRDEPLDYDGFDTVCDWLQTSSDSRFTGGDIVSLALPDGRLTYSAGRLIESTPAGREESEVDDRDLPHLLRDCFGILL